MKWRTPIKWISICTLVGGAMGAFSMLPIGIIAYYALTSGGDALAFFLNAVSLGFAIGASAGFLIGAFVVVLTPNIPQGHCPRCSYSYRGLRTDVCPECGSPLLLDDQTDTDS